jgi:hypothetical protein
MVIHKKIKELFQFSTSFHIPNISIDHLWLISPPVFNFITLCLTPLKEGDLWWHLKFGSIILQTHKIPQADLFSFTAAGNSFNASHSWLSELLFSFLFSLGGLSALVILQALIAVLITWIVLSLFIERGFSARISGSTALLIALALYPFLSLRPQSFSFLFFSVFYSKMMKYRNGKYGSLWILPFIMLAWVNMHGAWAVGLLFLLISLIISFFEKYFGNNNLPLLPIAATSFITFLATFINPIGIKAYRFVAAIGNSHIIQSYVSEWQTPSINDPITWAFFFLLFLLLFSLAYSRLSPSIHDFGISMIFLLFALKYIRMVPFFVIVVSLVVSEGLNKIEWYSLFPAWMLLPSRNTKVRGSVKLNNLILAILIIFCFIATPILRLPLTGRSETSLVSDYFPIKALDFLSDKVKPETRVYNLAEWGGFITWHMYPKVSVFVDGRVELYPEKVWNDYLKIYLANENWQDVLNEYAVDYLILSKSRQQILIRALEKNQWNCIYEDSTAAVFSPE